MSYYLKKSFYKNVHFSKNSLDVFVLHENLGIGRLSNSKHTPFCHHLKRQPSLITNTQRYRGLVPDNSQTAITAI